MRCQWASKMRILRDGNVQYEDTSTTTRIMHSWCNLQSYPWQFFHLCCGWLTFHIHIWWDAEFETKQMFNHQSYSKKFECIGASLKALGLRYVYLFCHFKGIRLCSVCDATFIPRMFVKLCNINLAALGLGNLNRIYLSPEI